MANQSKRRKRALLTLEIAFVALLALIVVTSDGTSWQGNTVHAGNAVDKAQKQGKKAKVRSVPPEGIAEKPSSLTAQVGTPLACTGFDFEGGATDGFTVEAVAGTPLWHVTDQCRANLAGHSTPFDFYYGQETLCNYNTGGHNAANLISPTFNLSGTFPPYSLGFNYLLFVESSSSFDTTFVDISTNGGTTWTQVISKANLVNDNQWHNKAVDITATVGTVTSIKVRFRFDSIDNLVNSSTGWHVDDVVVCGNPFNACIQDDSSGSILQYNSVTGAYQFSDCHGVIASGTARITVRGSITTLQDNQADRRLLVTIDRSSMKATASLQLFPLGRAFTITDRNIGNNTCACPGP